MKQSKFNKVAFLSLLLIILWLTGKTQIPQNGLNIQSPNAASLGLFGEIPVSLFTGVPDINIPLYNLSDGKISIPISLNYHASGVRPDQHPGWVGMGWSLSAGGMISRIVKNLPDETSVLNQQGYYWSHSILNTSQWSNTTRLRDSIFQECGGVDLEPDKFMFNFPGYTGEFYLSSDGSWKVKCDKPLKVTFNGEFINPPFESYLGTYASYYPSYIIKSFKGFTITVEDGTQYVFGDVTDAIEYSIPFFEQTNQLWIAGTWYLKKIIKPNGQIASFSYERGPYINQMSISKYLNIEWKIENPGGVFLDVPCNSGWQEYPNLEHWYNGSMISPVYLKSIQTDYGNLTFFRSISTELRYKDDIYSYQQSMHGNQYYLSYLTKGLSVSPYINCYDSLQWNKLDSIHIENKYGVVKSINFNYNNISTERLKLLSVREKGSRGEIGGTYSFNYDVSEILPDYLANRTDHWGFYNNRSQDLTNYINYGESREANPDYLRSGTLNKIIYPTGGSTEFIYEPNSYSSQVGLDRSLSIIPGTINHTAGGLRIKKIINFEDINHPEKKVEKEYFYVKDYNNSIPTDNLLSSGVLGGQFKYYFDDYSSYAYDAAHTVYYKTVFSSQSVLPMTINSDGCHVGYTTVIEKRSDNSFTKYTFSNFDNGYVDARAESYLQPSRTPYEPYNSFEEERDKLLSEEVFNSANQLVKKRDFTYVPLNKENEYIKSLKALSFLACPNTGLYVLEGTAYKIYTYSCLQNTETETIYDPINSTSISTVKQFIYDPTYRLLKTTSITNSEGKNLTTSLKYPFDMIQGNDPIGTYQNMITNNITGPVVEETQTVDNTQIKLIRNNYSPYYFSNTCLFLPATVVAQNESYPIETRFRYHSYDNKGNILAMSNEKGAKTSYIYDYKSHYPIAEVKNANSNFIAYTSFEADGSGNWNIPSSVRDSLCTAVTGKKSYDLANGSITKSGLDYSTPFIVSYWSLNGGRLVNGLSPTHTGRSINGWTYYEHSITGSPLITVSGNGLIDELRLYPSDAQMTTYSYMPLIGIKDKCDANNNITYFSYDYLGRLAKIKDCDKNILKEYTYNYGANPVVNGIYYNTPKSQSFAKNDCPSGTGTIVAYPPVGAGLFSSTNQDDADQLAQNYINANGQNYANTYGSCAASTKTLTIVLDPGTDIFQLKFCTITIRDANSNIVYTKYLNTLTYPFTTTIADSPSYTVTIVPGNTPLEVFVNSVMKDVYSAQTWSQITGNISINLSSSFY